MKKILTLNLLRTVALVVVLAGVVGSIILVLYKGRNNDSVLLIALFLAWVLSPFIALLVADKVSKRWTDFTRKTLYILMLALTILSLLSYSGVLRPTETKTAFVFLVLPLISWVLIVILLLIARSQSK
jgi:uncharacterized membrane protein YhaH (DUF805 family)